MGVFENKLLWNRFGHKMTKVYILVLVYPTKRTERIVLRLESGAKHCQLATHLPSSKVAS